MRCAFIPNGFILSCAFCMRCSCRRAVPAGTVSGCRLRSPRKTRRVAFWTIAPKMAEDSARCFIQTAWNLFLVLLAESIQDILGFAESPGSQGNSGIVVSLSLG